jgi:hypothetical protein
MPGDRWNGLRSIGRRSQNRHAMSLVAAPALKEQKRSLVRYREQLMRDRRRAEARAELSLFARGSRCRRVGGAPLTPCAFPLGPSAQFPLRKNRKTPKRGEKIGPRPWQPQLHRSGTLLKHNPPVFLIHRVVALRVIAGGGTTPRLFSVSFLTEIDASRRSTASGRAYVASDVQNEDLALLILQCYGES